MPKMTLSNAISEWEALLPTEALMSQPTELSSYEAATCGSERSILAVLKPTTHDQVEKAVAIANANHIPLYPISQGKQWGMGSRLPVNSAAALIDLSAMNRIIEVNERYHYAVVEPGVTQRQLLDYIAEKELKLMLNVTGSTSDTSLIGNAMDRGVGYFDSRAHGISNMQIVLGNGTSFSTGFGHYKDAKTKNLYPHGIGPALDGIFPQGNFGIVTSACIDLMPKPEGHMAAIIKIDDEAKLPQLIEALVQLHTRGVITTVAHVGNRERSHITLAPLIYEQLLADGEEKGEQTRAKAVQMLEDAGFGPWSAAIGILGDASRLAYAKKEIKKAVAPFAKTMFLTDALVEHAKKLGRLFSAIPFVKKQLILLLAMEPVYGFTRGSATDKSLKAVYWAAGDFDRLNEPNPDHSDSGVLFCLPIIPAFGETVLDVVRDTRETFARYGFEAAITVNLMTSRSMEGVVSLAFDRTDKEQAKKALECIREMETRYIEQGYPPYRVGINSMDLVVKDDDPFWQTVRDIKTALDPNNIIAPGRYNLS